MDILYTVMELLNSTPSPPINVLPGSAAAEMEPNNLSQSAARVVANNQANIAAESAPAATTQALVERNLDLKLPILSSSSSDSEIEEPANSLAGTSAKQEGERAASPPPNCAICLGRCKNKCFTDSCKHQFCFKCLCEWSKVKPECPLCKQTFKSIIHNVKSKDQFEEYHVQPPTVQIAHPPFEMDFQEMRIFGVVHPGHNRQHGWSESGHRPLFDFDFSSNSPYSSASTGGSLSTASGSSRNRSIALATNGSGLHNQYIYRGELLDLYRQEYPGAIANSGTLSQLWRRYVYDRKLYAMPVADITGRFRESSARFYRDNPSQIHRLMPWINRDIVCLLRQTQHDVTTVLESINSALTLMNILSPAFRRRLQPYLGTKTAHFIHELNNFARSPYDMIGYDRAVQYSLQSNEEEIVIEFTSSDDSSDNEQIDVAGDGNGANGISHTISASTSSSRSARAANNAAATNAINLTIHNRLTSAAGNSSGSRLGAGINGGSVALGDLQDDVSLVIDLIGESDNNETTSTAQATTNSSTYQSGQNAANSESDLIMTSSVQQPLVAENIELTSGSSDECEFVLERKPPHLRTPEMVSLDSASDSDVVFVEESKPLNKTSFSSSEGEQNDDTNEHKHSSNRHHHNKIAALVESKKRNQAANLVKSEQNETHTEVYNLGASTSAALRLSLQRRGDKSRRTETGSSRLRRDKYALRNNDKQSRTERQVSRRRGKRLDSESSYSSTSSSTTVTSSSSSTTSSTNTTTASSSSSSDEDYVATTTQRRNRNEAANTRRRRKTRKTKKRKNSNSANGRKRDNKKRKKNNNDLSSEEDDDEDDNGHMGKNFALVMAINERKRRQNVKQNTKTGQKHHEEDEDGEEHSDGENSWRLKAVNEPLRKQQQLRAKSCHKSNERKRRRKTQSQTQLNEEDHKEKRRNERKRQKRENQMETQQKPTRVYDTDDTSSDESDNINLIQLKTKLIGQDSQHKEVNSEEMTQTPETNTETRLINTNFNPELLSNNENETANTQPDITATLPTTSSEYPNIPTETETQTLNHSPITTLVIVREMAANNMDASSWTLSQNDLLNFTDDSNDNDQNTNSNHNQIDNNDTTTYHNDSEQHQQSLQQEPSCIIVKYNDDNNDNTNHNDHDDNGDNADHEDDNAPNNLCDNDETLSNIPTNLHHNHEHHLNESNVFADATSMSTTTTDTILNEAAEQISSAAVNFYNPQQTFNTADFADENSTNSSSSSDSSMSSTTTSLSSSSNSDSSNTNSYSNYEHS
ncbi:topoisomerase I-interacting protein isoform 2-T2 [Cochliomyia hominivorax]